MRSVESIWYRNFLDNLGTTKSRFDTAISQSTSGKKITQFSDNPADMSYVLSLRNQVEQAEQFEKNISTGKSWLSSAESALSSIVTNLYSIITKAEQGASEVSGIAEREILASDIEQKRDAILNIANTEMMGKFLFAGSATDAQPFTKQADTTQLLPDGRTITIPGDVVYNGNSDRIKIQADFSIKVDTNVPGDEAFGINDGSVDIFATLQKLVTDLRSNNTTEIGNDVQAMNTIVTQLNDTIGKLGNNKAHLDDINGQLKQYKTSITSTMSTLEDADMAEVISNLSKEQVGLQATLRSGALINKQSLMDYI